MQKQGQNWQQFSSQGPEYLNLIFYEFSCCHGSDKITNTASLDVPENTRVLLHDLVLRFLEVNHCHLVVEFLRLDVLRRLVVVQCLKHSNQVPFLLVLHIVQRVRQQEPVLVHRLLHQLLVVLRCDLLQLELARHLLAAHLNVGTVSCALKFDNFLVT